MITVYNFIQASDNMILRTASLRRHWDGDDWGSYGEIALFQVGDFLSVRQNDGYDMF